MNDDDFDDGEDCLDIWAERIKDAVSPREWPEVEATLGLYIDEVICLRKKLREAERAHSEVRTILFRNVGGTR